MRSGRPQKFDDMIGQKRVIGLARKECKGGTPRHQLLYGPPGLGKTTLAEVQANETGLTFVYLQAGALLSPKKVSATLMDLGIDGYDREGKAGPGAAKYLILVDEVHKLQDFDQWHPILSNGELSPDPHGGTSWLPRLTVIAATNYPNLLPEPFKTRFPLKLRMEPYTEADLVAMITRKFPKMKDPMSIAARSRGSARTALDFAETVEKHGAGALDAMEVDEIGLLPLDRAYLDALRRAGRPLSLTTVAAMVQEDPKVIRAETEPFLLRLGLIAITPKGRELLSAMPTGSRGRSVEAVAR